MESKRIAGRYAADLVQNGWVVGLGTGSTFFFALERLAERVEKDGLAFLGVPTSHDTETKARSRGIELTTLDEHPVLDVALDGADEVDGENNLIKGGGGALLREKIVAAAAEELVVIVDESKLVARLGADFLLPVEILPFAYPTVSRQLKNLGCHTFLRTDSTGRPFVTDNHNHIVDCRFDGIGDPAAMEVQINMIPGVVENGLFVGRAGRVVVGVSSGKVEVR